MWTVDVYPRWSDVLLTSVQVETEFQAASRARAICQDGIEHKDEDGDLFFTPGHAIDQVSFYTDD